MTATKRKSAKSMDHSDLAAMPISFPNRAAAKNSLTDDLANIFLLIFLYVLQGIPLGLASAMPYFMLGGKSQIGYDVLANFSWVLWPFSLKLIWAPIVDTMYMKRFGRRKSWLIPVQYAIGIDLIAISFFINDWLQRPHDDPFGAIGYSGRVRIFPLTLSFFLLTFLAATQDIVVDGWALTMLSKANVGWASTCNSVGQVLGNLIAFLLFLALESPEVSNSYLRSEPIPGQGIVSAPDFIFFWGIVFIVSTTLVAIIKRESDRSLPQTVSLSELNPTSTTSLDSQVPTEIEVKFEDPSSNSSQTQEDELELNLPQTYSLMFGVIRLRPIQIYMLMLIVAKFAFAGAESLLGLKLIELGVSKERLVFLTMLTLPVQTILPLLVTKWTNGPQPLSVWMTCMLPRVFVALSAILLAFFAPNFRTAHVDDSIGSLRKLRDLHSAIKLPSQQDYSVLQELQLQTNSEQLRSIVYSFSNWYYLAIFLNYLIYTLVQYPMFVAQMAFNAKISDPAYGGTYMTLLNTVANLASTLPQTVVMYLVDPLTNRECNKLDDLTAGFASLDIIGVQSPQKMAQLTASSVKLIKELGQNYLTENATCKPMQGIEFCERPGGECSTHTDGFYIEVIACSIAGFLSYFLIIRRLIMYLQSLSRDAFRYTPPKNSSSDFCGKRRRRLSS